MACCRTGRVRAVAPVPYGRACEGGPRRAPATAWSGAAFASPEPFYPPDPGKGVPGSPRGSAVEDFQYIVVGAGTAGCVLAARLSQDPASRVLLLEAGVPSGPTP